MWLGLRLGFVHDECIRDCQENGEAFMQSRLAADQHKHNVCSESKHSPSSKCLL